MKLLVLGRARHGKDSFCDILWDYCGLTSASTSKIANELFMYEGLKDMFGYENPDECYRDRVNHRQLWFDLIRTYTRQHPSALGEYAWANYDLYNGVRSLEEFKAIKDLNLFDATVWIDASDRLGYTIDNDICEVTVDDCDYVLTNNGTLDEFIEQVVLFYRGLEFNQ